MNSSEKNFLQTTQQLAGTESINTTRLLILNSAQASSRQSPTDLGWVVPKANKRSYLQQRILLQKLKIWHTFKSVNQDVELVLTDGTRVPIFKGNWTEETLANYLTSILNPSPPEAPSPNPITVSYDPYQMQFTFCPNGINISSESTANKYLGFPEGEILNAKNSQFPPVALKGPQCINVWTNFTMNNIPVSSYLSCVPIFVPYGQHIFYDNNDNSESTLCLDSDLQFVRLILKDEFGNELEYPDNLVWEAQLGLQSTIPDGFSPLSV